MHWEKEDGKFPWGEVHGNFIVSEQISMIKAFLEKNCAIIDNAVESTMKTVMNSNSDILTKGRQTFCPFTNQSVSAPVAYKRMFDFFKSNVGCGGLGCLDWIRSAMECFEKDNLSLILTKEIKSTKRVFDRETSQFIIVEEKKEKQYQGKIEGIDECRQKMLQLTTRFASYLKHKERGKKDRRAIASAGMILRMFLHIIEEFHLALAKELPGSTISIGGEEKKAKITSNLGVDLRKEQNMRKERNQDCMWKTQQI